ncbi:hypothetical protein Purlil1_6585 [Purpureocillium lilacinum]|uniref:Uncharacterized protein n=1 Tax=Purpureocillium lilacinum TaxID=33203 RepID=A0ABR0BYQ4_PURLI|nr:hypothetical protein Purlil1_6585 [Purpureocillium lilacinum]
MLGQLAASVQPVVDLAPPAAGDTRGLNNKPGRKVQSVQTLPTHGPVMHRRENHTVTARTEILIQRPHLSGVWWRNGLNSATGCEGPAADASTRSWRWRPLGRRDGTLDDSTTSDEAPARRGQAGRTVYLGKASLKPTALRAGLPLAQNTNASTSPSGPVVFASRPPATLVARPDSARWRNTPPCAAALGNQTFLGEDTRQDDKGPRRREPGSAPSAVRRRDGAQRHREAARAEVLLAGSVDEGMEPSVAHQRAWSPAGGARSSGARSGTLGKLQHVARRGFEKGTRQPNPSGTSVNVLLRHSKGAPTPDGAIDGGWKLSTRVQSPRASTQKIPLHSADAWGGRGLDPRGLACIFARVEEGVWVFVCLSVRPSVCLSDTAVGEPGPAPSTAIAVPCLSQERSLHDSSVRLDSVSVEPSDRLLPSAAGGGGGGGAPSGSSWSVVVPSVCMCPVPLGMAHLDFNSRRRAAPPPSVPPAPTRNQACKKAHSAWAPPLTMGHSPENAPGPLAMASKPAK